MEAVAEAPAVVIRTKRDNFGNVVNVCVGKNNTCKRKAKRGQLCPHCHDCMIHDAKPKIEVELRDGIKWRKTKSKSRPYAKVCVENDCVRFAIANGKCHAHNIGSTPRPPGTSHKIGEMFYSDGKRYIQCLHQKKLLCEHTDETGLLCDQLCVKDHYCKTHSPRYHCKFTGAVCKRNGIIEGYCQRHRGNVQNK